MNGAVPPTLKSPDSSVETNFMTCPWFLVFPRRSSSRSETPSISPSFRSRSKRIASVDLEVETCFFFMDEIRQVHQLSLVVYPIVDRVLAPSQVVCLGNALGFMNHQQYVFWFRNVLLFFLSPEIWENKNPPTWQFCERDLFLRKVKTWR